MSTGAPAELLVPEDDELGVESESATEIAARSPLELFARRLRRDKVALVALIVVILIILVAILAPVLVDLFGLRKPNAQSADLRGTFGEPIGPYAKATSEAGTTVTAGPMGVDNQGRDVMSRVLYGARVSLEAAFIGTAIIVLLGVVVGTLAAFYRGWVDTLVSRTMDVILAFPVLVLAIGLGVACADGCRVPKGDSGLFGLSFLHVFLQPGLSVVIFVIVLSGWPYMARIVRGQVLSLREREFVEASRSLGASDMRIMFKEILPNLIAPIIVYSTVLIPQNILLEASLSYLGVGVDPNTPSWGAMLSDATPIFQTAWWFMTFPGLALLITVLAFNLVGDGLQDALNPRTAK